MMALVLVGSALAGTPDFGEGRLPPSVTLSVQPLKLMDRPTLEGSAEFRLGETRSFAITGAKVLEARTVPLEVGAQIREYIAGDFGNGIAIGAQASFRNPQLMRLQVDRTRVGPMLAVKLTLALFTIEARGGPELTIDKKGMSVAPALDLSAGISF